MMARSNTSTLSDALASQSLVHHREAHAQLQQIIKNAFLALKLVGKSTQSTRRTNWPAAWLRILQTPWTEAQRALHQWPDDPCPPLPGESELPDRAAAHAALELLWNWEQRTWQRIEPSEAALAAATFTNPNDPRDKFIYDNLAAGKTRAWIRNRINKKKTWEALHTEQGISAAAKRYASRHDLAWPLPRTQ
jgi:hypothetical protein